MSSSQTKTKRAMSIWQFTLLLALVYGLGLFVSHQTTVFETVHWSGYELEQLDDNGNWTKGNRFNVGSSDTVQDVRFRVTIDNSEKWQQPVGLMVGGPYTAEVFWDEQKLAGKGTVGETKAEEIPGTIDSISFIPNTLLTPGEHLIRMRISTQYLTMQDDSVFHYIWLAPYRENGRRDLRYYATPLLILSALIVLSFQSFRIGHNAGNPMHIGLGLFGFCITVLLMSEVSRAIVNYTYHFHELRGIFGWVSNICAGLALVYTCANVTKDRLSRIILTIGVIVMTASHFFPMSSGDGRLAMDYLLLVSGPAIVFATQLFKRQVSYLSTLPLFCLACFVSNSLSTGLFLDSFQFVSALILIGGAWVWVYVDIKNDTPVETADTQINQFTVRDAGAEQNIAVTECLALKGEGNYTSLVLLDGRSVLHQDGLGTIMDTKPKDFVRVHKSYAVNVKLIEKLKSAPGSKYWLEMTNHENIPVSRYRVAELRNLLAQEKAAS